MNASDLSYLRELDDDFENACPTVEEIAFVMNALLESKDEKILARNERNRVNMKLSRARNEEHKKEMRHRCSHLERENELLRDALAGSEALRRRCAYLEADNVAMHKLIQTHPELRERFARVPKRPSPPRDVSATSSTNEIVLLSSEVLGERI